MVCLLFSNLLERQKREDNEIPSHLIHEIKTKGYDVIGVQAFLRKKEYNIPTILLCYHANVTSHFSLSLSQIVIMAVVLCFQFFTYLGDLHDKHV